MATISTSNSIMLKCLVSCMSDLKRLISVSLVGMDVMTISIFYDPLNLCRAHRSSVTPICQPFPTCPCNHVQTRSNVSLLGSSMQTTRSAVSQFQNLYAVYTLQEYPKRRFHPINLFVDASANKLFFFYFYNLVYKSCYNIFVIF